MIGTKKMTNKKWIIAMETKYAKDLAAEASSNKNSL